MAKRIVFSGRADGKSVLYCELDKWGMGPKVWLRSLPPPPKLVVIVDDPEQEKGDSE